jgi:hypothetical protein
MNDDEIDIFDPDSPWEFQYANPQLRGQHPGDSADLSSLQLLPYMAKDLINDVSKYGKQIFTGEVSDEDLLQQQPLTGDAKTIADAAGSGLSAAMNFRGLASTPEFQMPSAADVLGGAIGMYQDAKPELIDIFGEPAVNRTEGTALLGSMFIPGRVRPPTPTGLYSQAAESALDLQRKTGNAQGFRNDLTGKGKVKPDELKAIGFDDHFEGRNDITREEVQRYINDNQVQLDETILRDDGAKGPFDYYATDDGPYMVYDGEGRALQSFAEADDAADAAQKLTEGGSLTKYSQYTLGGGAQNDNYREILIQLPKGEDVYKGGHYPDVDNVAMTLRLNDRVDFDGKKGLLIEEIQDDWASAGKDFGYKGDRSARLKDIDARKIEIQDNIRVISEDISVSPEEFERSMRALGPEVDELNREGTRLLADNANALPDRPFKSTDKSSDYNVAIKRALVEAANGDYDRLYLTTGQQQADRYDLSKQINEIRLGGGIRDGFTVSAFDKKDKPVIMEWIKSLDELPALIGKDAAKAIVDQPFVIPPGQMTGTPTRILAGQDLSIGGEGMKQFYDQTYRNALGKMVKPYGVKVGQADLDTGKSRKGYQDWDDDKSNEYWKLRSKQEGDAYERGERLTHQEYERLQVLDSEMDALVPITDTVYSIDITPEMREDFKNGIPMFAQGGAVDTTDIFGYNLGGSVSEMMRDPKLKREPITMPTGPQVANFAANLPPGAATIDAFGGMPGMIGPDAGYTDIFSAEPNLSLGENIGQGNYGTAALQGLGVIGDAMTPIPLAGTIIGTALRAPRAAQLAAKVGRAAKTGGIDSLPQEIVRVGDGVESIDAARIVSSNSKLTKKQTIAALKNQFMSEHPPVGSLAIVSGKPKVVDEALIRRRANAYVKKMEAVPAVFRREAYRLDQNIQTIPMQQRNIIHPEMLIGKTGVPVVGDRSIRLVGDDKAGRGIMSIRGVPLSSEHIPQGGIEYSIDNLGRPISLPDGSTSNRGWASMQDAANKKQGNMLLAATETDSDDILGIYSAMSRNSINFSADALIPMMKQLPAIKIPKKDIKAFDEAIRKGVTTIDKDGKVTTTARPDWLGLEHPEVFDQLLGKGEFSRDGAGAFRKTVLGEMMQKKWENLGFPLYDDMIDTMTVPELGGFMKGESGLSMFKADPSASTFDDLDHLSYGTSIPGEYFGGLAGSLPPEVMYPEMFEMLSRKMTDPKKGTPRPLSYDEQVGSLMMDPKLYEQYTPEKVEKIIEYMNKNLGTNYAEGGEVNADLIDIFDV